MNYLKLLFDKQFKHDMLNKFFYKNTKHFPKLKKVVLDFKFKANSLTNLTTSLLVLEIISKQKATLTLTKSSNIVLKIRKGNPVGCKVTLSKKTALNFLTTFLNEVLPKSKNRYHAAKLLKKNYFSVTFKELVLFEDLENKYYLFNNLNELHINFITNCKLKEELVYMLKCFKFPE